MNEGLAYEVKYDESEFKPGSYKKFEEAYPGFTLQVISRETRSKAIDVKRL